MTTKPTVTITDWDKLDIRVGTIESAEAIPESHKLLNLQVNFGEFKRQIISGIAKGYLPETLIGKQVAFIVNLEPRMLAGLESQGMILACDTPEGLPDLLNADKPCDPGSAVH